MTTKFNNRAYVTAISLGLSLVLSACGDPPSIDGGYVPEGPAGTSAEYGQAAQVEDEDGVGGLGEECYWDSSCDEGLRCMDTCQPVSEFPGELGGPCFEDFSCNGSLECRDDVCMDGEKLVAYYNTLTLEDPGELYGDDSVFTLNQELEVAEDFDASIAGQLPGSVDLGRYLPPVGSQGSQGSCVSWAMTYGLTSYLFGAQRGANPTSSSQIFSPAYTHNQVMNYANCHSGPPGLHPVRDILQGQGAVPLSVLRYSTQQQGCTTRITSEMRETASQYRIRQALYIDKFRQLIQSASPPTSAVLSSSDINNIKTSLSRGYPVAVAIRTYEEFMRLNFLNSVQRTTTPRTGTNQNHGYHAILVVGYDDSKQTFKIMNSWGRNWGKRGFGEISYDVFAKITGIAYTAAPVSNAAQPETSPEPEYPSTPPPTPSSFTCSSVTLGRSVPQNTCIQIDAGRGCSWHKCVAPNDYDQISASSISGCATTYAHATCDSSEPDPEPQPAPQPDTSGERRGQIVATLYWRDRVDLDINAVEPSGTTVSHSHSALTPDGGSRSECNPVKRVCNPNDQGLYSETITWGRSSNNVSSGIYRFYARNYTGGNVSFTLRVEYYNANGQKTFERDYQGSASSKSPIEIGAINLQSN